VLVPIHVPQRRPPSRMSCAGTAGNHASEALMLDGEGGEGAQVAGCWLLVDVVVAHGKPCQQQFAVGVGADSEQGPAVRAGETPGQ